MDSKPHPSSTPQPVRIPRSSQRQRKHRSGNIPRARTGLVVVFIAILISLGFFCLSLPNPPGIWIPILGVAPLWLGCLIIALWRRQKWARILLITLFGAASVVCLVMIPNSTDAPADQKDMLLMAYFIATIVSISSAAYLVYSRDIHRLTSRDRE
jgi:hypothetical protein